MDSNSKRQRELETDDRKSSEGKIMEKKKKKDD